MVDLQGARCGTTPAPAIDRLANRADVVHERRLCGLFYVVRCSHFACPDQVSKCSNYTTLMRLKIKDLTFWPAEVVAPRMTG